ncbi:MAG: hypothetical protein R3B09_03430 [Nannocystaceae bacterium]
MSERRISLTDFVDFVTRAGMPKLTKVKQLKHRGEYHPYADFYRAMREAVIAAHRDDRGKASIGPLALHAVGLDRRVHHYDALIAGYVGWWGRRQLEWFAPPQRVRAFDGFDLRINPELGLRIDSEPHVIKLYFKEPALSKRYAEVVACVMHEAFPPPAEGPAPAMAILDVRRRRLHRLAPRPELSALVAGELAALTAMWARV